MAIKVNTGGLTEIHYKKGHKVERDLDLENSIDKGYAEATERKRKERIKWIIGIVIFIFLGVGWYFLR